MVRKVSCLNCLNFYLGKNSYTSRISEYRKDARNWKVRLAVFFSGFSYQSKGMYLVAKPKNEDYVSCLADAHLA